MDVNGPAVWSVSSVVGFSRAISNVASRDYRSSRAVEEIKGSRRRSDAILYFPAPSVLLDFEPFRTKILAYSLVSNARVTVYDENELVYRIHDPVMLLWPRTLVVFAHGGKTPSFVVRNVIEDWNWDKKSYKLVVQSSRCFSFMNLDKQISSLVTLEFSRRVFETISNSIHIWAETFTC